MTKPRLLDLSVTRFIQARPDTLYDLVSEVTHMPEFSPETVKVSWAPGSSGPRVGAKFRGSNKLGFLKWTTKPTVTVAETGRRFAFQVPGTGGPAWTYTFQPKNGGTQVTETAKQTEHSPALVRGLQRLAGVTDRADNLRAGMTVTLDRLADIAATIDADQSVVSEAAVDVRNQEQTIG